MLPQPLGVFQRGLKLKERGKTVIIATHDPKLISIADKTYLINVTVLREEKGVR